MVTQIPLSKTGKNKGKYVAFVEWQDSDLAKLNWTVSVTATGAVYAYRSYNGCNVQLHQIIMERMRDGLPLEKGQVIDHVDGNGLNNTRVNLRIATSSQNNFNAKRPLKNTTGYKGVTRTRNGEKWRARIKANGKEIHIGTFDTPEEAYAAYCEKARELHGEFARFE